jgi:hypothetical protein
LAGFAVLHDLVYAQQTRRAVEVGLHRSFQFPELVGVAGVGSEADWVDLYVAGAFGQETLVRHPLSDIAWVKVTDIEWGH